MAQVNGPMVSETSICNLALSWLGTPRIASLDAQTTPAMLCRDNYATCRDSVLEERNWTFAQVRAKSETEDMDEWETAYLHRVQEDWLHVHRVYRKVSPQQRQRSIGWVHEGRAVLAREPVVYMMGTKRVENTGDYTPLFVQAVAARIAATLAIPITENRNLMADMWALYETFISQAAVRDGQQGANESFDDGALVKVRSSGGVVDARTGSF